MACPKVTKIRVEYSDGSAREAIGEDADKIMSHWCNCEVMASIHGMKQWAGPCLKEVEKPYSIKCDLCKKLKIRDGGGDVVKTFKYSVNKKKTRKVRTVCLDCWKKERDGRPSEMTLTAEEVVAIRKHKGKKPSKAFVKAKLRAIKAGKCKR